MAVAIASGGFSASAVAKATPDKTAAEAQKALAKGQVDKAITMAEGLVAANPREARYRGLLGQAYLRAGRFESAIEALNDAMKLGDNSAKTALSLALANAGAGKNREAVAILDDWRDAIPVADLGLAMALAGETNRGVGILSDALRAGQNTPKLRQNLAYAYALDGRWRESRTIAALDVPADQLDGRISDWASKAKPEDGRLRVAGLIGAPVRADSGMPAQLALNASGEQEQLAAETTAQRNPAPAVAANGELAPVAAPAENPQALAQYQPVGTPAEAAPAVEAPAQTFASTFGDQPVVQPLPAQPEAAPVAARAPAAPSAPRFAQPVRVAAQSAAPAAHRTGLRPRHAPAAVIGKGSSHAVQLGSFSSEQGARRAWGYYAARNPELRNFKMAITPATVHGKKFWRVAAAGLDNRGAYGLCGKVKSRGGVCFAYATGLRTGGPAFAAKGKGKAAPAVAARFSPARTSLADARRK
ncbi:MAG: CDC27 family protein, partial [Novosphingobium sp.]